MPTNNHVHAAPALSIPSHVVWHDAAATLVLFNSADGSYHTLNEVASQVWRALAAGQTLPALIDALCHSFAADAALVEADVRAFIGQALHMNLLRSDAPAP
ncbi:MAG: PqqD family protein [Pseudomonadota bacterium]